LKRLKAEEPAPTPAPTPPLARLPALQLSLRGGGSTHSMSELNEAAGKGGVSEIHTGSLLGGSLGYLIPSSGFYYAAELELDQLWAQAGYKQTDKYNVGSLAVTDEYTGTYKFPLLCAGLGGSALWRWKPRVLFRAGAGIFDCFLYNAGFAVHLKESVDLGGASYEQSADDHASYEGSGIGGKLQLGMDFMLGERASLSLLGGYRYARVPYVEVKDASGKPQGRLHDVDGKEVSLDYSGLWWSAGLTLWLGR
jgi:hypothetical protein